MKRYLVPFVGLLVAALLALVGGGLSAKTTTASASSSGLTPRQEAIVSGFASFEFLHLDESEDIGGHQKPKNYFSSSDDGCIVHVSGNVKVNTNCLNLSESDLQGRGQAQNETAIAQDPLQTSHVVASYNDYRRGDATCGASYSRDGGKNWMDATVPNGFTRGTAFTGMPQRQYWQGSGDTAVAWDTHHNAYLLCQAFMRGEGLAAPPVTNNPDGSSAIYVFRSTGNFGASYNFPARPVVERNNNPQNPEVLLDKPYLTVDNHVGSQFADRIYVTWTDFNQDTTAKIYEAYSTDYGETFSAPVLVSGGPTNLTLCPNSELGTGTCDVNQDSVPFTGSDGALYVAFNNYNGPNNGDHAQILLAKSTDGGVSFGQVVKVADYYDLPDCATYQNDQDSGRLCVPEKGASMNSVFRANNYPSGVVNPKKPQQVVVTFGSYINRHSNESNGCVPTGGNTYDGVKTAGACNNDILLSVSNNGGTTFAGTTADVRTLQSVTQAAGQATTDQFWQWAAFTSNGMLAVSYYDRQYGTDETTGSSDVSLSGSSDLVKFNTQRVTSSSMPPPTEFPDAEGNSLFLGDYTGLTAVNNALPLWSDTREPELFACPGSGVPTFCRATEPNGIQANDEDAFTSSLSVP
jgi:hypothetical protein